MNITWEINAVYIVAMILTAISYFVACSAYAMRTRRRILIVNSISVLILGSSFPLLSAWSGFYMMGLVFVRNVAFLGYDFWAKGKKRSDKFDLVVLLAVMVGVVSISIFTWEGISTIFAALGTTIFSVALYQKNVKVFRWLSVPGGVCWLVYMTLVGSFIGVVFEGIFFGVVNTSIIFHSKIENIEKRHLNDKVLR